MASGEDALAVLRSIDATLKAMLALAQARTAQARAAAPKAIASDRDLDGTYGDPVVKFLPRDWMGESFKGCHFSQCPAAFLDMLAETFDYFASQAEAKDERTDKGKPVADYKRQDAARARGWAKRIRDGRGPAAATTSGTREPGWTPAANDGWD